MTFGATSELFGLCVLQETSASRSGALFLLTFPAVAGPHKIQNTLCNQLNYSKPVS